MERMTGRVDSHVGGHLAVVADGYFRHVYDGAVIVGEEVLSCFDMGAVIAVEGRIDERVLRFSEQFLYDPADFLKVRAVCKIQFLQDPAACFLFFHYRGVGDVGHLQVSSFDVIHVSTSLHAG